MNRVRVRLPFAMLLSSLFPKSSVAAEDQAVLVYLVMANSGLGSKEELSELFKLEEQVAAAVQLAHAGEHDGNEVGEGEFTIYCYGPNADKLFLAIQPVITKSKYAKSARAVVRYGKPGAKQVERRFQPEA